MALQSKLKSTDSKAQVALQNIYERPSGAFTGELSTAMMKDLGINWTLIGHSERRKYFHDTDQVNIPIFNSFLLVEGCWKEAGSCNG